MTVRYDREGENYAAHPHRSSGRQDAGVSLADWSNRISVAAGLFFRAQRRSLPGDRGASQSGVAVRPKLSWHSSIGRLHLRADHAQDRAQCRDEAALLQGGCRRIARDSEAAARRCLHQSGGSAERKLVIRQWRSPVRRRDNYIVRYDERDGTLGAMNTGKYPYQGTASEMSPKTTALNGFSRPVVPPRSRLKPAHFI